METELDKPLGQHRKPRSVRRGPPRLRLATVCGVLIALLLFAGSLYAALIPNGVREGNVTAAKRLAAAAPAKPHEAARKTQEKDKAAEARQAPPMTLEPGDSGATIQRTLTSNGLTVTKITPGSRPDDGPALISAGRQIGQAPQVAAQPDPDLVEESRFGKLPKRGDDGARPMDVYARPASGDRGTRIAIVVGGLGLSQTGTLNAINALPPEVTLGFAATGNSLQRWMQRARETGHEILLQVPMQPYDQMGAPDPRMLKVSAKPAATLDALHRAMGRITNYTGIMNYLGGRFMSDAQAFQPVLRDVARRGLLFLDDGTASGSLTKALAPTLGAPFATADLQLDATLDRSAIMKRLGDLEDIARRKGSAIGVASAFDESVAAISAWAEAAKARGIEIVGVSALVDDPERKE